MKMSTGLEFAPVDLGNMILMLGQIRKVVTLSEGQQRSLDAVIRISLEDGTDMCSKLTAEQVCRAMWNTITTFTRL